MIWFRYRAHLEAQLLDQARLYNVVIGSKDRIIQWQVEELQRVRARCERLEVALTPSPRNMEKTPIKAKEVAIEGETAWNRYLTRYMAEEDAKVKEQANVPNQERAGVHESISGNEARPDERLVTDAPAGTEKLRPA